MVAGGPAASQTVPPPVLDQDWQLARFPDRKAILAVAAFDNGVSLAARCVDGDLDLTVNGLPPAPRGETMRLLGLGVGEEPVKEGAWTVANDPGSAFSRVPAMVARQLAKGGQLQIVVPAEAGERRTRYVMQLNPSSTAIEETLTACGRPLVDPRDNGVRGNGQDGLPYAITWRVRPAPRYPDPVGGRLANEGYAVLSCLPDSEGRLTECQVESEQPRGFNFGRTALESARRARLGLTEEAVAQGQSLGGDVVIFTIRFRMAS